MLKWMKAKKINFMISKFLLCILDILWSNETKRFIQGVVSTVQRVNGWWNERRYVSRMAEKTLKIILLGLWRWKRVHSLEGQILRSCLITMGSKTKWISNLMNRRHEEMAFFEVEDYLFIMKKGKNFLKISCG